MESNQQNFVQTTEEGIDRVLKKNYAFFMESTMIDYNVQKNCNLTQIGGLLDSKGYGIATQQGNRVHIFFFIWFLIFILKNLGSPYTEEITLKLLEMQEKGIIQQMYNRWWKGNSVCVREDKKDGKANPLGVQNVGGIFVVLIGGLLLAVIVSVVEFSYYAKNNSDIFKVKALKSFFYLEIINIFFRNLYALKWLMNLNLQYAAVVRQKKKPTSQTIVYIYHLIQ